MSRTAQGVRVLFPRPLSVINRNDVHEDAAGIVLFPGLEKVTLHHTNISDSQDFYLVADPEFLREFADALIGIAERLDERRGSND